MLLIWTFCRHFVATHLSQRIQVNSVFQVIRSEVRIAHRDPDIGVPEDALQHDDIAHAVRWRPRVAGFVPGSAMPFHVPVDQTRGYFREGLIESVVYMQGCNRWVCLSKYLLERLRRKR